MASTPITGLVAPTPTAWASSGRHIVVPFGEVLRVFDITSSTPKCVAMLQGHAGAIVSVVSAGNMRVASASEDGTVKVWDISDGACLQTIDVGQKISAICHAGNEQVFCVGSRGLLRISLSKQQKSKIRTLFGSSSVQNALGQITAPQNPTFLAMTHKNILHVRSTKSGEEGRAVLLRHYSWLTSIAVSSDGSKLAVGDEAGAIYVYPNPTLLLPQSAKSLKLEQSRAPSSKLHWHSSPVRGLAFTQDGNALVSGGAEAVLVTWKMTRNHFGTRSFLPRLGAAILGISISNDEATYALTQADNSVRLIAQTSSTITSMIRGIKARIMDFQLSGYREALTSGLSSNCDDVIGITRHPQEKGHVLISGSGNEVQRFDMYKGEHVNDLVIIPKNVVTEPKRFQKGKTSPDAPRVTHVQMDNSGKNMATVDQQYLSSKADEDFNIERIVTTLRFWRDEASGKKPSLTTVFRQPHGSAAVSSVSFHPQIPVAVTTSPEGKFKLWREVKGVKEGQPVVWRNEGQFGYKDLPCMSASFSGDGSLLAVGCGSVLTLWHVEDVVLRTPTELRTGQDEPLRPELDSQSSVRVELLHALVHPPAEETIQSVCFVQTRYPLFVSVTEAGIYVWNALTQGIWWSSRIRTHSGTLAADVESGCFALAVKIPTCDPRADVTKNDKPRTDVLYTQESLQEQGTAQMVKTCNATDGKETRGLENGGKCRRRSDKLAKRERLKRKHQAVAKVQTMSTEKSDGTCPMDSAVAFFDATSPYAKRIHRLATGVDVRSLEFMHRLPKDQNSPPPLACLDSRLNVTLYGAAHGDGDQLRTLTSAKGHTGESELSLPKVIGKIDSFLGGDSINIKNHSVEASLGDGADRSLSTAGPQSHPSTEMPVREGSCASPREICGDYFSGPVHTQAPVSLKSFDFINAILHRDKTGRQAGLAETTEHAQAAGVGENPLDETTPGTDPERNLYISAEQCFSRSEFFHELATSISRDEKKRGGKARKR